VGRPEFFDDDDGPIGSFHPPTVLITPSEVQVEDPVTMTIRVEAAGTVQRPPRRLRLEKFPGFAEQFYVEFADDPTFRRTGDGAWELTCKLKPRHVNVKAVPSFPFVFFTPGFFPPERGYQVQRTASVPLVVGPRATVQPSDVTQGADLQQLPESVYQIVEGPAVQQRASAWSREGLLILGAIGLLVPPWACLVWCVTWRRLYPDASRRSRWRRSHAAQRALAALQSAETSEDASGRAAAVLTSYLQERYDLTAEEPTPKEVGSHLERVGWDSAIAEQAAAFFRACDAARYGHIPDLDSPMVAARQLVLSLEAERCPAHASS
jgi:hypothetical protein